MLSVWRKKNLKYHGPMLRHVTSLLWFYCMFVSCSNSGLVLVCLWCVPLCLPSPTGVPYCLVGAGSGCLMACLKSLNAAPPALPGLRPPSSVLPMVHAFDTCESPNYSICAINCILVYKSNLARSCDLFSYGQMCDALQNICERPKQTNWRNG